MAYKMVISGCCFLLTVNNKKGQLPAPYVRSCNEISPLLYHPS